jgi:hypothetical protein
MEGMAMKEGAMGAVVESVEVVVARASEGLLVGCGGEEGGLEMSMTIGSVEVGGGEHARGEVQPTMSRGSALMPIPGPEAVAGEAAWVCIHLSSSSRIHWCGRRAPPAVAPTSSSSPSSFEL